MKNILQNFWVTLTRFKMASALNILGLTIAFAVFTIIMIQTHWEFTSNKNFPDHERIVRFESDFLAKTDKHDTYISRPHGDLLGEKATLSTDFGLLQTFGDRSVKTINESGEQSSNIASHNVINSGFISVFNIECLEGSLTDFNRPQVTMLNQSTAKKIFGNQSPIGKQLFFGDTTVVVAVIADFPENCTFKNGMYTNVGDLNKTDRSNWGFEYFYKITSVENIEPARNQFVEISKEYFGDERAAESLDKNISVRPISEIYFTTGGGNYMLSYTLIGIAILIIFIAVINFINFFMALVPIRIRAININKIFGTPVAVLRVNIVCETIGIVLIAFGLSLLLVHFVANSWLSEYVVTSLQIEDNISSVTIVGFIALTIGVLAGLYPAWYITKFNPMMVLRGSFGRSKTGQRARAILITVQYVISIALIIGAMFIELQTTFLRNQDMGFNRDRLLTVNVGNKIAAQPQSFLDILKQNPDIKGIAYSTWDIVDIKMGWGRQFNGEQIFMNSLPVSWNYPEFMDIELADGRLFRQADASKTNGTMIVNETAARKYNIKVGDFINGHSDPAEVVGIVKDFNFTSMKNSVEPVCLYEFGSNGWYLPTVANIRISPTADFAAVSNTISAAMKQLVPTITDEEISIQPFDETVEALYAREAKLSSIITLFSIVAIIIALAGVFGLVVFEVQYRKKEIALRKVMGATVTSIPALISHRFIRVTVISAIIAIPLGYIGVWIWIQEFAYRLPLHWWIGVISFATILIFTLIIVGILTLKSATENPIKSLKSE